MIESTFSIPVTTITNKILESFSNSPTVHDVIEEIVNLLGQKVIQEHAEAHNLLSERVELFTCRNGRDQLVGEEFDFYNWTKNLVERSGAVSSDALNGLKTADLGKAVERKSINELLTKLSLEQERFERTVDLHKSLLEEKEFVPSHMDQLESDKEFIVFENIFYGSKHPVEKVKIGDKSKLDNQSWDINGGGVTFLDIPWQDHRGLSFSFKTTKPNCRIFSIFNDQVGFHTAFSLKTNGHPYFTFCEQDFPIEKMGPGLNDGKWHKCELAFFTVFNHPRRDSKYQVYFDNIYVQELHVENNFHSRGAKLVIGREDEIEDEFIGKVRGITISEVKELQTIFDAEKDSSWVHYSKDKANLIGGEWHLKNNCFSPNSKANKISRSRNFRLTLTIKAPATASLGILSFGGVRITELSNISGRAKVRVSSNGVFCESFVGNIVSNHWHTWKIISADGLGEKIYFDGRLVGCFPPAIIDHAAKDEPLMLAFSSKKEPCVFTGSIKNFTIKSFG